MYMYVQYLDMRGPNPDTLTLLVIDWRFENRPDLHTIAPVEYRDACILYGMPVSRFPRRHSFMSTCNRYLRVFTGLAIRWPWGPGTAHPSKQYR